MIKNNNTNPAIYFTVVNEDGVIATCETHTGFPPATKHREQGAKFISRTKAEGYAKILNRHNFRTEFMVVKHTAR